MSKENLLREIYEYEWMDNGAFSCDSLVNRIRTRKLTTLEIKAIDIAVKTLNKDIDTECSWFDLPRYSIMQEASNITGTIMVYNDMCICGNGCMEHHFERDSDDDSCINGDDIKEVFQHSDYSEKIGVNIKKKISDCKKNDRKNFHKEGDITFEYIKNLILETKGSCAICADELLFANWFPYCCHQFSIDRKDNNMPHDKHNCRITCYYCNCWQWDQFKNGEKICSYGCHNVQDTLQP